MKKETKNTENKRQVGIRLCQSDIDYLIQIKAENHLSSLAKACEFVISEHRAKKLNQNEDIANLIVAKLDNKYQNTFTRIRLASNGADKNIQIIMEILNSFIYNQDEEIKFIPTNIIKTPLLKDAEDRVGDRIAHFKQNKDNN